MARLTRQDISIEAGFCLSELLGLEVHAAVNQHVTMFIKGILDKENALRLTREVQLDQAVRVKLAQKTICSGLIEHLEVKESNEVYIVTLNMVGFSRKFDLTPRCYFYQDTKQSYVDMLDKAVATCDGSLIATSGEQRIGKPILQYLQTDWDFALRTASLVHTVITPDITADYPQICLGLPAGGSAQADETKLEKRIRLSRYRKNVIIEKNRDVGAQDYISYYLEDERIFSLGDRITVQQDSFAVMELTYQFIDGVMRNQYVLGTEADFALPPQKQAHQTGLMLEGIVKGVSGETVQICLQIPDDAEQESGPYFEYAPLTNNGMYAMPPEGTKVAMEWMSDKDGDCKVVRAVRDGEQLAEHEQRSMITEHGKKMHMTPSQVSFLSDSNRLFLKSGIQIKTSRKLKLTADKGISISSAKKVRIKSPQQIFFTKPGIVSGIWMEGRRIHIQSANTQMFSNGAKAILPQAYREVIKPVTLQAGTVSALAGATPAKAK